MNLLYCILTPIMPTSQGNPSHKEQVAIGPCTQCHVQNDQGSFGSIGPRPVPLTLQGLDRIIYYQLSPLYFNMKKPSTFTFANGLVPEAQYPLAFMAANFVNS